MKPTHKLKVLNKVTDSRAELGAGWINPDGSISIKLNICVVIQDDPDLVYTLFPVRSDSTKTKE